MSTPSLHDLFDRAQQRSFTSYRIGHSLRTAWPDYALVEGEDEHFDFDGFAEAGHCERTLLEGTHAEIHTHWKSPILDPLLDFPAEWDQQTLPKQRGDGTLGRSTHNGVYRVDWNGKSLVVAVAAWAEANCNHRHWWVLSPEQTVAEQFLLEVCRFGQTPRHELLVFNGQYWRRDPDLYDTIQASSMDDLILAEELKNELIEDFKTFLTSRKHYVELGVPWKRGVLFLGPPGNGKTHCLRAVLKLLALPVLYIQSFHSQYNTDELNLENIFQRARHLAPCVLVFEDLDALVTDQNRSFFLNQLDGFAANAGLLTIATTNHPDRLDPAIIDRPSRFDRKYHFVLPTPAEREVYLARWGTKIDLALRPTTDQLALLAAETEGFSFAYLKELCVASLLRWLKTRAPEGLYPTLRSLLVILRSQMRTGEEISKGSSAETE